MLNAIKGFFIGLALVIPGLSGSIFAVVVGLYEPIMAKINQLRRQPLASLRFLTPIAVGALIGIIAATKGVLWLTVQFPLPSYALFIGLMLGLIPFMWRKVKPLKFHWYQLLWPLIGFGFIYGLTQLSTNSQAENHIALASLNSPMAFGTMLFAGFFVVALMMIPGISGAIMLMVIGQYGTIYNAMGQVIDFFIALFKADFHAAASVLSTISLLVPFTIGAVLGLFIMARLMTYLLKKFEAQIYAIVWGVVLAAILILVQRGITPTWQFTIGNCLLVLIALIAGGLLTFFFDKPQEKKAS
ncbi:hypothetical protein BSQ39_05740 [Loigolactobacillus backii]|uniref:DUF368 domain-containing protein n=1 Tax=Loigolactobacillus backii TaxID=375175 RepID=UPI000C1CA24D|nr:DUF368 domain-containing protein [Loigolactobacillus backii]PIO83110.1 hypothetical protein BSQ39_05740 [Loigolactobacillus backii]